MSPNLALAPTKVEDPLAHLPCSTIVEYRKGEAIYNQEQPSTHLHLVLDGKIKVGRTLEDGRREVVLDIYQADDFFGESGLLALPQANEFALAMEVTKVMRWTAVEIEALSLQRPRLAIALIQLQVQRLMDFGSRIESFSSEHIARRLARSLIRFAERLGHASEDGSLVHMTPFTHELLAQYVGTSREIVTQYMNRFRREGYLQYSRKGILLHRDALQAWLKAEPLALYAKAAS